VKHYTAPRPFISFWRLSGKKKPPDVPFLSGDMRQAVSCHYDLAVLYSVIGAGPAKCEFQSQNIWLSMGSQPENISVCRMFGKRKG
jgi:hypothetical protein